MQSPGEVYLCQVSETVSCGACCGLYNVADASRQSLCRLLEKRTAAFAEVPREMEAILSFGHKESEKIAEKGQPMPEFHHCPYLGFIGPGRNRVGCLLHPLGDCNKGIDFRGLSHYGSMTCSMYFCPTHHRITPDFKEIIRTIIDDWYLFGLIVQETDLLEAFYNEITRRLGVQSLDPESALKPPAVKLWARLFDLKITWPYACPDRPFAAYFFNDDLYPRHPVDYSHTNRNGSRYDAIFRELHTVFASDDDLTAAEQMLDELFDNLSETLGR